MNFEMTQDQVALKRKVHDLAVAEFAPRALEWDSTGEFAWENLRKLSDAGLMGLTVPQEYGGQGRPFFDLVIALEELAAHCHITAMILQMNLNGLPLFVRLYGNEEQKHRFLREVPTGNKMYGTGYTEFEAGSALTDIQTTAIIKGSKVVINGTKHLTTHGHVAHYHMVLARFGKCTGANGLGLVIVPNDAPGFSIVGREETMRGGNEAVVSYNACTVPSENILVEGHPDSKEGFKKAIDGYNAQRCGNAAISVGLAQGALDLAISHARERRQFGKPIGAFQGIQWMIAEMGTKVEAARALVYRAAALARNGLPPDYETSIAKLFANDMMLLEVVSNSLQIHGWKGFIRGNPIEWMYRAARGQSIAGGTTQMIRNYLGSKLLNIKTSQRA